MSEVTILPGDETNGPFGKRDSEHYLRVTETGWEIQHSVECYLKDTPLVCWTTAYAKQTDLLAVLPRLGTYVFPKLVRIPDGWFR